MLKAPIKSEFIVQETEPKNPISDNYTYSKSERAAISPLSRGGASAQFIPFRKFANKRIFDILFFAIIISTLFCSVLPAADPFLAGGEREQVKESPKAYLRQTDFYIPYQLNNESDANSTLNLYVSKDLGVNWELFKALIPANESGTNARQFNVRVGADGEYWFAIRPSRVENRTNPPLGNHPDVRIIVDTNPPQIKIETQKTGADKITVYWTMTDRNPATETVKFYQRYSETSNWEPIPLNPRAVVAFNAANGNSGINGQFTVQTPNGISMIYLKGEASDRAKTPTVVLWNIPVDAVNSALPGSARQPVAGSPNMVGGEFKSAFIDSAAGSGVSYPSPAANVQPSNTLPSDYSSAPSWSAIREGDLPYNNGANSAYQRPGDTNLTSSRSNFPLPSRAPVDFSRAMIINKPQFDLDYEITSVGRSGIGSVELWVTKTQGANWSVLATDTDNITPISVELPGDGVYGLKLVIKNGAGLGGRNPLPGETPASWVILDRTPPTGELKSADIRVDSNIPQMRLRWASSDEYPSPTPVAMYWSRDGQAPWNLIADQLAPAGDYLWTMPNDVPARIIIKMEIQDKAGNSGTYTSPPIAADASSPAGFIRDIRPTE